MQCDEIDIESGQGKRIPSPGCCIYCGATCVELTDEHVVPYALGKNAAVLLKSSCKVCQAIIQPYEQHVLRRQLGTFRAQVGAPTRRPKDRPKFINYDIVEVDEEGSVVRQLGSRSMPIETAPIALNLWASPPPRIALVGPTNVGIGHLWSYIERDRLNDMCREIGIESGAKAVAVFLGDIDRTKYLRALAKTGHAFACANIGHDAFEPLLIDVILCRSDDVSYYVGDLLAEQMPTSSGDHSLRIFMGVPEAGPIAGYVVVSLQLYPALSSPSHIIVVGKPNELTELRFAKYREFAD